MNIWNQTLRGNAMARHPLHPLPVPGAATYWAEKTAVMMGNTDGYTSIIDSKRTHSAAASSAMRWQKRENAAVTTENKRRLKNGLLLIGSPKPEYWIGYMQGRGAA